MVQIGSENKKSRKNIQYNWALEETTHAGCFFERKETLGYPVSSSSWMSARTFPTSFVSILHKTVLLNRPIEKESQAIKDCDCVDWIVPYCPDEPWQNYILLSHLTNIWKLNQCRKAIKNLKTKDNMLLHTNKRKGESLIG